LNTACITIGPQADVTLYCCQGTKVCHARSRLSLPEVTTASASDLLLQWFAMIYVFMFNILFVRIHNTNIIVTLLELFVGTKLI